MAVNEKHEKERELNNLKNEPRKVEKSEYEELKKKSKLAEIEIIKLGKKIDSNNNMYKLGIANGHLITSLENDLKLHKDKIMEKDAEIEELKKVERNDT